LRKPPNQISKTGIKQESDSHRENKIFTNEKKNSGFATRWHYPSGSENLILVGDNRISGGGRIFILGKENGYFHHLDIEGTSCLVSADNYLFAVQRQRIYLLFFRSPNTLKRLNQIFNFV
jgi:hypothetical protein